MRLPFRAQLCQRRYRRVRPGGQDFGRPHKLAADLVQASISWPARKILRRAYQKQPVFGHGPCDIVCGFKWVFDAEPVAFSGNDGVGLVQPSLLLLLQKTSPYGCDTGDEREVPGKVAKEIDKKFRHAVCIEGFPFSPKNLDIVEEPMLR